MHVALISPYPPSIDTNSLHAELHTESVCSVREGTHFTVIAGSYNGATNAVRRFENGSTVEVRQAWSRGMAPATILRNIRRELAEPDIDLLHIHFNMVTFGGFLSSQSLLSQILADVRDRLPSIVTLHSTIISPVRRVFTDLFNRCPTVISGRDPASVPFDVLTTGVVRNSSIVAMPSAAGVQHIRPVLDNDCNARLYHIPLASLPPALRYKWSDNRRESEIDNGPRVAYVGNVAPYKGVDDLIMSFPRVLREIKEGTLVISGSQAQDSLSNGHYTTHVRRLIKRLNVGSRVTLQPQYLSVDSMLSRIDSSDVVVYPFKSDGIASMSGSVHDTLPSPKPVVISDSPRLEDYRSFSGVTIVESGVPETIAQGIVSALYASSSRTIDRAKELAPYSPERISSQYMALYEKALALHGRRCAA